MKKLLIIAAVLALLCTVAVLPAGADDAAVPSPTHLEPEIKQADLNGLALEACIEITTVQQAEEKATDITQEERDVLLDAYNALVDGTESLPIEGEYVVREIVDVSFKKEACRDQEDHGRKDELLKQEDAVLTIDFDMGVEPEAEVCVMTYINGVWEEIISVENNGDGTVTCVFADLCPVAFAVIG